MSKLSRRMWINQPSSLEPLHKFHRQNVLAVHEYDDTWRIYFVTGFVESMQAQRSWLSEGWI
jgi:hypothetical protein